MKVIAESPPTEMYQSGLEIECQSHYIEYRLLSIDDGYRVGSDGSVWTRLKQVMHGNKGCEFVRGDTWKKLYQSKSNGYRLVHIRTKTYRVHVLVLETFIGPRPRGMVACHGPNGKSDNSVHNLCWGTRSKNGGDDRVRDGSELRGEKHGAAKLTNEEVLIIRDRWAAGGVMQKDLAREFGVTQPTISEIVNGRARVYG